MDNAILEKMLRLTDMRIVGIESDFENKEMHLRLEWRTNGCSCPGCGATASPRKSTPRKEPVRHLNWFEFKTFLYFDSVEMECQRCKKLFNRRPSFLPDSHFCTVGFVEEMFQRAEGASIEKVSSWYGVNSSTFSFMYYTQLARMDETRTLPRVRRLGIDEISMRKGRGNFVLVLYDLDTHEVLDVLEDRHKATLKEYLLEHKEDMFSGLEAVCIDMWRPYKNALEEVFPEVEVVVDRFHVMKPVQEAIHERCRDLARLTEDEEEKRNWKKDNRIIVQRSHEAQVLRPSGQQELEDVLKKDPILRRLYWLKEDFREVFQMDQRKNAENALKNWIRRAKYLQTKYLKDALTSITNWKKHILSFVGIRITNGVAEGFNCKIKLVKRMGYGFKNFDHFRLRILHTCSKSFY